MRLDKSIDGEEARFDIYEDVVNYQDIVAIKSTLQNVITINPDKNVKVIIHDAMSLPSSIIGSLLEFVEIHNIKLTLVVHKNELYSSMQKLTLVEILNVKKA